ncbi:alpha/beta fold hydrolase [Streptomyces sp. NPDC004237]|uniref:alpha/beta hydrolase n=1 Tax=Streptomyces sp. NPDC004237 TaxID=3154455 RepID=UPI0033AD4158
MSTKETTVATQQAQQAQHTPAPAPALERTLATRTSGVTDITLDAGGITLSGLHIAPDGPPPRAVVVAVHGGGMTAGYFDGQAHPSVSLLGLGASLGFAVLSLDRPGYGRSAREIPEGQSLAEQSATLHAALDDYARRFPTGAGFLLVAHSFGGKVALTATADDVCDRIIGVDVSGCGHRYAVDLGEPPGDLARESWKWHWGPLRLYPPNSFRYSRPLLAPMPPVELRELRQWSELFPGVAARVRVPVRFTFAEYENWWLHDTDTLTELAGHLRSARVTVDRQPDAGHNISLGWAARSYHLRVLGFLEELLACREQAGP